MTPNGRRTAHVAAMILLVGIPLFMIGQAPAPQNDPRVGTWKLNLDKSRYAAGTEPRMQVRRIETRPDGFSVFTLSGQDYQGNPMFIQSVYKFDGKEYAEYNQTNLVEFSATGKPSNLKSVYRIVDEYTVEMTRKDPTGKITGINTQSLSKDGKTLTATLRNASGETVSVQVSERQ